MLASIIIVITSLWIASYVKKIAIIVKDKSPANFDEKSIEEIKGLILKLIFVAVVGSLLFVSIKHSTEKTYSNNLGNENWFSNMQKSKSLLNSSNYNTIQPDFIFNDMGSLKGEICDNESDDFYCIHTVYGRLGKAKKTKEKYLGKIIKTPFMVWSYDNDSDTGTIYVTDAGCISQYQQQEDAAICHLVDEENIDKLVEETKNKKSRVEVIGILKEIGTTNGKLVLDPCYYIKKRDYTSPTVPNVKSSHNIPQISSKLVLDISKPVYEKNENISLLAQWTGADVDCKILEEKVKETLDNRHFEIVDNSISCAGNDNKSLIQLRVQFKSPRIGKLNIPAITLENNISSNSVDFSVRDLEALQNAVVSKNIESIKAFLSSPADLDAIKIDGEHPVAHFIKDDMAFAQELIKLGASPDVIDKNGYTPLMYAVIRQDNELLDLLLSKKVDLNILDKKGRTAIMYAAIKNNIYAAKKLVEHKADIYKSKDGKWTAYQYAQEMKHTEIAKLLKSQLNEILIIFDGCSSCEKKIKSLEKIVKQQYPIMNISYIRYTPQDGSNKYDHFPDQNYPIIKLKRQKDSDDFGSNSGNILGNWDGTEKQLEKIMYKEL